MHLRLFMHDNFFMIVSCVSIICACNKLATDGQNNLPDDYWDNEYVVFNYLRSTENIDTISTSLSYNHPAILLMQKRAAQLARIEWTPQRNVPQRNEGFFPAGQTVYGIPYSSVKEMDKYIGLDVSFKTFMTAVNNPRSVLYTERVDKYPYNGLNCAAFYGTVCSAAIDYALGLDRPYLADDIGMGSLPFIKRVFKQDFKECSPGDIIWKKGHVVLVTSVERDDQNNVLSITILESAGKGTSLLKYSLKQFIERWKNIDWVLYRYTDLEKETDYIPSPYIPILDDPIVPIAYNSDLCFNRGDDVTYREGEDVIVNVLSNHYSGIELINENGEVLNYEPIVGMPDITYKMLRPGKYAARLVNEEEMSEPVHFEIIQTDVVVNVNREFCAIEFTSVNSFPEYVVFCEEHGGYRFFSDITDEERQFGKKLVKCMSSTDGLFVKVFFKGDYGRVSNVMIPLK